MLHILRGSARSTGHNHETAAAARRCEEAAEDQARDDDGARAELAKEVADGRWHALRRDECFHSDRLTV